jgi:L-arabinose isomerase
LISGENMKTIRAGLLPLYIKLYDSALPKMRPIVENFVKVINDKLTSENLLVIPYSICCVKEDFEKAVSFFEKNNVDVIITLHLAYSPSLESAAVLSETNLPIIVLDTTPDYLFDETLNSEAILYNHGIHGVQDLCNLLNRNGKDFEIFAGHFEKSDVCKRVADCARAIFSAKSLNGMKVGLLGKPFEGMGDFAVSEDTLKKLGISVVECSEKDLSVRFVNEDKIKEEYEKDKQICKIGNIEYKDYRNTEKIALTVREWITARKLGAFSMNFQAAGLMKGFDTMPFSEASKQMAYGIGYAGEGDVLTAALTGSLLSGFRDVTFAEMFCPNWQQGSVFLSHMGEANLNVMENLHMIIKDFPYAKSFNPTCIMGHMKGGRACFINIAPNKEGYFDIILADGEMVSLPENIGSFNDSISGWFKPDTKLEMFLERYSIAGGTHHGAIVYGVNANGLKAYAKTLNLKYIII